MQTEIEKNVKRTTYPLNMCNNYVITKEENMNQSIS